jgi:hypothetical protein
LISNSRHLPCSLVFLSQSIVQLPTIIRRNTDSYVLFGACSYTEIDLIYKEVSIVKRSTFWKMFQKATAKEWGFLVCSIQEGKIRFFESYNRQLIVEAEIVD